MDPTRTPYPFTGECMRLKTLDLFLAVCSPEWRGRAFLSLGEKNKKLFEKDSAAALRQMKHVTRSFMATHM